MVPAAASAQGKSSLVTADATLRPRAAQEVSMSCGVLLDCDCVWNVWDNSQQEQRPDRQ